MEKIIDTAYKKAIEVIQSCSKKQGFFASGLTGGYDAVWARDSMIIGFGASLINRKFQKPFKASLQTLEKAQTENGQIPNCVGSYNIDRKSNKTYNSIDSSLWYIIGHYIYALQYHDNTLLEKYKKSIARALIWLRYQDPNEDGLLSQQPTMDWQDAFPHKYGNVINTQALYYGAMQMIGGKKLKNKAEHLKKIVNGDTEKYLSLYEPKLGYYLPWNWKNHDGDREQEQWFDSLGNILAIITGLAKSTIASNIIKHIKKEKINEFCGLKAIWPPIKKGDKEWHSYFSKCDAKDPHRYLNGGYWPFIGGFYIAALVKLKKYKQAEIELKKLAIANMQKYQIRNHGKSFEFNEWLDGLSGKPQGEPYQGWSAGTFIYAYECVKQKKVLFF